MRINKIDDFVGGWFVGNFAPSLFRTGDFEVAVKRYAAGDSEPVHHQLTVTEITVIVSGRCRLGGREFGADDVVTLDPLEAAGFEALEDTVLVAVKFPSLPADKVLGEPHDLS